MTEPNKCVLANCGNLHCIRELEHDLAALRDRVAELEDICKQLVEWDGRQPPSRPCERRISEIADAAYVALGVQR